MYYKLNYSWQQLVLDAFVEFNPQNRRSKVNKAECAIYERLGTSSPTLHERTALQDSLRDLELLLADIASHQADLIRTG